MKGLLRLLENISLERFLRNLRIIMMMYFPEKNDIYAYCFIGQSDLAPVSTDQGGGQILICVAGRGYYQEWGQKAVEMKPDDCINILVGEKHWHSSAPDSLFFIFYRIFLYAFHIVD